MTRAEIDELVAELRECASLAVDPVAETAELEAGEQAGQVLVVDRAGWARANAASFGHLMDPVIAAAMTAQRERRAQTRTGRARARLGDGPSRPPPWPGPSTRPRPVGCWRSWPPRCSASTTCSRPRADGCCSSPPTSRRWRPTSGPCPRTSGSGSACTRRPTGCSSAPTRGSVRGSVPRSSSSSRTCSSDPASTLERLVEGLGRLPDILRAPAPDEDSPPGTASHGPHRPRAEPRAEGAPRRAHRRHVAAGGPRGRGHGRRGPGRRAERRPDPRPVPGPPGRHRARWTACCAACSVWRPRPPQYRDGARFVRDVSDRVGTSGFNAVWSGPDTLPAPGRAPGPGRVGGPGPRLSAGARPPRGRRPPRGAAGRPGGARRPRRPRAGAPTARCAPTVVVGVSGGADSLALLAAPCTSRCRSGLRVHAVRVDHGWRRAPRPWRAGSPGRPLTLGADDVRVVRVAPARGRPGGPWVGGPEDAARTARLAALAGAATRDGARAVLLGHTLDDQAEQVLLGLARGLRSRALAGMPAVRDPFVRPLLGLRRDWPWRSPAPCWPRRVCPGTTRATPTRPTCGRGCAAGCCPC